MEKDKLRINLLGISFDIKSNDEDMVYLETILNRYQIALENTKKSAQLEDPLKLAILTGFLLCDEIEKIKAGHARLGREIEQRTLDLITRIDEAIPAGDGGQRL